MASVALIGAGIILGSIGKGSLRDQADAWRNVAAERDSLREVSEGIQERQADELEGQRQANAVLQEESRNLSERARVLGGRVVSLTSLVVELRAVEAVGAAVETIWTDTSGTLVRRVSFDVDTLGVRVRGHTRSPPPTYWLTVDRRPPEIRILLTQQRSGAWTTTVETPQPWAELGSLDTRVVPLSPTWWDRHKFGIGAGLGAVGMLLILAIGG